MIVRLTLADVLGERVEGLGDVRHEGLLGTRLGVRSLVRRERCRLPRSRIAPLASNISLTMRNLHTEARSHAMPKSRRGLAVMRTPSPAWSAAAWPATFIASGGDSSPAGGISERE